MDPDPTRAYFWPAVNNMLTHFLPRYFLTQPTRIFLTERVIPVFAKKYPLICTTIFFSFQTQSFFKNTAISLSFLPCDVMSFPHLLFKLSQFYPLPRGQILFLISLLYIKPLFPINKQFCIDSYPNWEGRHSTCSLVIAHNIRLPLYSSWHTLLARVKNWKIWTFQGKFSKPLDDLTWPQQQKNDPTWPSTDQYFKLAITLSKSLKEGLTSFHVLYKCLIISLQIQESHWVRDEHRCGSRILFNCSKSRGLLP